MYADVRNFDDVIELSDTSVSEYGDSTDTCGGGGITSLNAPHREQMVQQTNHYPTTMFRARERALGVRGTTISASTCKVGTMLATSAIVS